MSSGWQPTKLQKGWQPDRRKKRFSTLGSFTWDTYEPLEDWATVQADMTSRVRSTPTATYAEVSAATLDYSYIKGGTLAPNGCIYLDPWSMDRVIKIDPSTDSAVEIGDAYTGSQKWAGGALARNGKIYCVPSHTSDVLVIDTSNDTTYTIDNVRTGNWKWWGAAAVGDFIYGIPFDTGDFLKIDTRDDTFTFVNAPSSAEVGVITGKYAHGVLAANGMVYVVPRRANHVTKLNPSTDTYEIIGDVHPNGTLNHKHIGAAVGLNGCIYAPPRDADRVLKIDPSDDSVTSIGPVYSTERWQSAALGGDGKIYCAPRGDYGWLIIDPSDDSMEISSFISAGDRVGAVSVPGEVIGLPTPTVTSIARITVGGSFSLDSLLLDPFNNGT